MSQAEARHHYIDGKDHPAAGGEWLDEFYPGTGQASYRIARGTAADVDAAARSAFAAWAGWRDLRPILRGRILMKIAETLRAKAADLAKVEHQETGRPMPACFGEVETAAAYFEFYGGLVNALHGEVINLGARYHSYTLREPFGVVGIILPWNAAMGQAARGIAPALASGNTVVAKPSEFTSVTLLEIARLAVESCGLPAGVLNVVTGAGPEAGAAVAEHPLVRKISFTGSVRAGRELGRIAADRIIPIGLELGGKSPHIIFADADLDRAAASAVKAFTMNAGQVCSAGTRILIQDAVYDQFLEKLQALLDGLKVGSGADADIGPIITEAQLGRIRDHIARARTEGVEIRESGHLQGSDGWFERPKLLLGVGPQDRVCREEIFGPVAAVLRFSDEAEAVAIANDSDYGLVAGLWTADLKRAHRMAAALEAGQIFVNEYFAGGVETPFGGYKQSGHGREKGIEALLHYTQLKCITINLD